jgi:hypothetical protein
VLPRWTRGIQSAKALAKREDPSIASCYAVSCGKAHRDGKHFVVRADEKLTALLELEMAVRARGELA